MVVASPRAGPSGPTFRTTCRIFTAAADGTSSVDCIEDGTSSIHCSPSSRSTVIMLALNLQRTGRIVAPASTVIARFYHKNVVDHYNNPRNVGSLNKNDPFVGTGLVGAPACGDVMKLQIKVDEEGNIIESCFKTFGCGSAIASSSVGECSSKVAFRSRRHFFLPTLVATVPEAAYTIL